MADHNKDRFKTIEILEEVEKIVMKRQDVKSADKQWQDLTLSINWLMLLNQRMAEISRHCVDMHFRSVSELDPDTAFHNTRDAVLNMAAACIEMVKNLEQNRYKKPDVIQTDKQEV